ncbi:tRNA (adenosine(37)-N6)-dimethylallyltransferase MiaA [uncultured Eubacterium sp.]|uniref:tRNA (adenosine(37)-N6)-dimethylallyltransferase MiaA n=1 Tax=Eubacterium sp. TaxID=142586 RepID=UPI002671EF02|nr:tRNA (adenosine(37)-N6)-dimethylallyltransferase MiaA [uncultured Eubacterium sp.]
MKNLVILTGPTAVGKTELSIKLAKEINGEIISADSVQVYRKLNIGSAKITKDEMQGVNHYLIDVLNPDEEFNVHIFKEMALEAMNEIYEKGKIPIIVGGTGFYIQALLYDVKFEETDSNHEYRKELEQLLEEKGNEYLHKMLMEIDPVSAENIHFNNAKRVIRALEYYHDTGQLISDHNSEQRKNESPYNFAYLVLNDERERLYDRINKRVDIMISAGLEQEVRELLSEGYREDLVSMQGIGYKEMIQYIKNALSLEEAVYLIKKNTRHFAKRQLTWFRREKEVTMINVNEFNYDKEKILENILMILQKRNIIKDNNNE